MYAFNDLSVLVSANWYIGQALVICANVTAGTFSSLCDSSQNPMLGM